MMATLFSIKLITVKTMVYMYDMSTGTNEQIAAGNFNFIHIISDYVFYEDYEGKTAYYYNISTGENKNFNPTVEKD